MKKVLVVVDYQYDFVAEDGLLSCKENAKKIEQNICNILDEYIQKDDDIIFTLDTHIKEHWEQHMESKSFGIHCEKGTKGHDIYGNAKNSLEYKNCKIIEKEAYAPTHSDIDYIINKYDIIEMCGIVTDICVLQTAIAFYNDCTNKRKKVIFKVIENACASFNQNGHSYAIDYMRNILGFEII